MSIVGGLVGSEAHKLDDAQTRPLGIWAERNAWGLILLGSILFWLTLAALLVFG